MIGVVLSVLAVTNVATAVATYVYRAKAQKLVAQIEGLKVAAAARVAEVKAGVQRVVADAKGEAAKVEAKADAVVAKLEAEIKKL